MASTRGHLVWRLLRTVLPPVVLCALVILALWSPIHWWLYGEEHYDQEAIREWIREARVYTTLSDLVEQYVELGRQQQRETAIQQDLERRLEFKKEEIGEHLKALGNPPTKMYPGQLPLFPVIYGITVAFDSDLKLAPIHWDSEVPRHGSQSRMLSAEPIANGASVEVEYHLHAYLQRQFKERQEARRRLWLSGLGIFFAVLTILWIYLNQRKERERQKQRLAAEQQVSDAERLRLGEELRRQEAERRHAESERQNLELKSQLFANIGIMAGSYAHNIKNLLVRPNDLLRRCLDEPLDGSDQAHMLREVKQTLGTVTERLQQILQTVRRDPSKSENVRIDLNAMAREMQSTWVDLAREKWKLVLDLEPYLVDGRRASLWIEGDVSHLQQAIENLLFNARDATFEMRNHLREQVRAGLEPSSRESSSRDPSSRDSFSREPAASAAGNGPATIGPANIGPAALDPERRQALIAAAGWKGHVTIRTGRAGNDAILEVSDNGIGMTEETRRRCLETHFSTKRDNALFAGLSAGMGLGLSFVTVILEHHKAKLEIDSAPLQGTTFRVRFPIYGG